MGRFALVVAVVLGLVFAAAGRSESDVTMETTSSLDISAGVPSGAAEPTLGTPATNAPGDETFQKDPFTLFSAEGGVPYTEQSADERAAVDRGRDTTGCEQQNDAFAAAVRERSRQARAALAESELGIDALEQIGVVP